MNDLQFALHYSKITISKILPRLEDADAITITKQGQRMVITPNYQVADKILEHKKLPIFPTTWKSRTPGKVDETAPKRKIMSRGEYSSRLQHSEQMILETAKKLNFQRPGRVNDYDEELREMLYDQRCFFADVVNMKIHSPEHIFLQHLRTDDPNHWNRLADFSDKVASLESANGISSTDIVLWVQEEEKSEPSPYDIPEEEVNSLEREANALAMWIQNIVQDVTKRHILHFENCTDWESNFLIG